MVYTDWSNREQEDAEMDNMRQEQADYTELDLFAMAMDDYIYRVNLIALNEWLRSCIEPKEGGDNS